MSDVCNLINKIVFDFISFRRCTEDLARIFAKRFDPGLDISSMISWQEVCAELFSQHHRGDFCAQFFFCICLTAKLASQIPIQAAFVACAVGQFVKCRRIIFAIACKVTARLLPWGICLDTFDDFLVVDKTFEEFLPFFG